MKKYITYLIILSLVSYGQMRYLGSYAIDNELINSLVTFFSITFGFYITSLAIFATSKYVSKLYKVIDRGNPSLSLLHTIVFNYRNGLLISILSIFYFLFLQLLATQNVQARLQLNRPEAWPFIAVVLLNFWYGYRMLNDLSKVIIQEAKNTGKL